MVTSVNGNTIPNVADSGRADATSAAAPAPVSAGVGGSAAYLAGLLAAASPAVDAGSSGLRSPINPENAEALLLVVESALDQVTAKNRAASVTSRFGAAQGALEITGAALALAATDLTTAQGRLATDTAAQTADTAKQTSLEGQLTAANQNVSDAQAAITDAPQGSDMQALQQALADAEASQSDISGQLDTAGKDVTADTAAVGTDNDDIAAIQVAEGGLTAALSQIATGLRVDVGRDGHAAADRSVRKETAYDEVAATAKHFRAADLGRVTNDRPKQADPAAARDGDRGDTMASGSGSAHDRDSGSRLAAGLADNLAAVLPILYGFAAAPPPVVSQTAALEAGRRLRLSL